MCNCMDIHGLVLGVYALVKTHVHVQTHTYATYLEHGLEYVRAYIEDIYFYIQQYIYLSLCTETIPNPNRCPRNGVPNIHAGPLQIRQTHS